MRNFIKKFRKRNGLSQTDVAKKTSTTPSNISKLETEQSSPSLTLAQRIASLFGVSTDTMFPNENHLKLDDDEPVN